MGCRSYGKVNHDVVVLRSSTKSQDLQVLPQKRMQIELTPSYLIREAYHREIRDVMELGKLLGKGGFSQVRIAVFKNDDTRKKYAVKSINKNETNIDLEMLRREISSLQTLDHPNIVKLYDFYEDLKYLHLVMEYWTGGELLEFVIKGGYSEDTVWNLMRQIILSTNLMHQNGLCHRDLKPQNFIFENNEAGAQLKLIDFGLSTKYMNHLNQTRRLRSMVGTPYYIAPEMIRGTYGMEWDVWSIGVIMYLMLSGDHPFDSNDKEMLFKKILSSPISTNKGVWQTLSGNSKDLIHKLLERDANRRIKLADAIQHPWLASSDQDKSPWIHIDTNILDSLIAFKAKNRFQQSATAVLVKHLEFSELKELREAFEHLDYKKTGTLTFDEIELALKRQNLDIAVEKINEIIQNIDYRGNGEINYTEFLSATLASKIEINEHHLWAIFKKFDSDNTGSISQENLAKVVWQLGFTYNEEEIVDMIKEVDISQNGIINFEEFKTIMMPDYGIK